MTLPNSIKILMISLLLITGCVTSTGPQSLSDDCPPGSVKIQDEGTGEYDCASEKEFEEIRHEFDRDL